MSDIERLAVHDLKLLRALVVVASRKTLDASSSTVCDVRQPKSSRADIEKSRILCGRPSGARFCTVTRIGGPLGAN